MNKHPFVQFAWLPLGCVLIFWQGGCADDDTAHKVAVDTLTVLGVAAVVVGTAAFDSQANKENGGYAYGGPAFGVSGDTIAQAESGQGVPFIGGGPTSR